MCRLASLILVALAALVLNSCVYVNTRRACADRGQQYQAVILPDQENLDIFKHNNKLYLRGVLTNVRRVGRDKIGQFTTNEFSSGQFVPIKGAPQHYVYRELSPTDILEDDMFPLQASKSIPKGARLIGNRRQASGYQIDSLNCNPTTTHLQQGWVAELPRYARPYYGHMVTSEHQKPGSHLCNTHHGFIIPVTPARANKHAWYAYPLAGVSFVVVDIPGTILASTVGPVLYGVAAVPCSIYEGGKRLFVGGKQ